MDSQAIQEIANQLGIATEQMQTQLIPQYAQMIISVDIIWALSFMIVSIILGLVFLFGFKYAKKQHKINKPERFDIYGYKLTDFLDDHFVFTTMIAIAFGASLVIFVGFLIITIGDCYIWNNFPESTFIQELIHTHR